MHIVVVDDHAGSRSSVARFLKTMGHKVTEFDNAEEALAEVRRCSFPIVLSDIKMTGLSGLDLLRAVSLMEPAEQPKVVLFTGHGSMESAIEALRMGAYDYLLKPVKVEELMAVINRIERDIGLGKASNLRRKKRKTEQEVSNKISWGDREILYVCSPQMRQTWTQSLKYHEDRSIPVLIQGETGTGKELIARLIHAGNTNIDRPFVDINCAAISANLFESELFGYVGGSFTGGRGNDQEGKFDIARGGTLFFDEVAEIPLELQAKLLRVVEEMEYYRVGGLKKIPVDARIICASNVDLQQAVNEGKFRRDLYYRLKIGEIILPPLRERKEDILPLAENFLIEYSRQRQKNFRTISKEAKKILLNHQWSGNIRELKNLIQWVVFMYDGEELTNDHLANAPMMVSAKIPAALEVALNSAEQGGSLIERHTDQLVQDAIKKHNGNKAATARYLGISRRSLYRLLKKEYV